MFEEYHSIVDKTLREILIDEREKMETLAEKIYEAVKNDGLVYAFGTGHSHMLVEEMFYRAGGLALVYPVLVSSLMLHEGAVRSSKLERIDGFGRTIAESLPLTSRDIVVVFSNSGSNTVPVEFAMTVKEKGVYVSAVTSFQHSRAVNARNRYGKKLYEVVDLAIDNHVPYGDTALEVGRTRVAPLSSIAGIFIINSVIAKVAKLFEKDGKNGPFFLSANTNEGIEHNEDLIEIYSKRIPYLR